MSLLLKDPIGSLDYSIDWGGAYLSDDELTDSSWSVVPVEPGGVTVDGSKFDSSTTTVVVSGGKSGMIYRLLNHVVTSAGREDSRSILLRVEVR